jgi:hypothetical protein
VRPSDRRGGNARSFMHSAKIVVRDEKTECSRMVLDELLAKAVREAGEPTTRHPHSQVAPLDVAR